MLVAPDGAAAHRRYNALIRRVASLRGAAQRVAAREVADRERIGACTSARARHVTTDENVFLVGGTGAVLVAWRATTINAVYPPSSP